MAERRTHPNGGVYERGADGQWHLVSSQTPAIGPAIGNDPKLPGSLQGQNLSNQNTGINVRVNAATEAAQIREANAKAGRAEDEARVSRVESGNAGAKREQELRSQFEGLPEVRSYKDAAAALGGMLRAPDTSGGDINIIYSFIKAQGPGPVAQGELDLAQGAASLQEDLERRYGKLTGANRLPARVRLELIESARQSVAGKAEIYGQSFQQYRSLAQQNGVNPERVTGPYVGDAIRPLEEKYIRAHGGTPKSAFRGNQLEVNMDPNDPDAVPEFVLHQENHPDNPRVQNLNRRINETDAFGSGMVGAADSLTLGLADEASAGLNALGGALTGQGSFSDLYGRNVKDERAYQDALQQRDPLSSFAGNVGGSVLGLGGVAGALRHSGKLGALATRGGGLGSDALYGVGYGAGSGDEDRLSGAAMGGAAALGGNLVGRHVVAPAVRGAASKLGYNPAPALPAGQAMVAQQALKANPEDVMGRLNQAAELKMPYALADADPRLRSLAGSAVRKSPDAHALASETIGPRGQGQAERALGLINENLAPAGDISKITADATTRARSASKDLYGKAMQNPAPEDQVLGEMLQTPAGQQAARDAYSRALNAGEKPADLSFEVDSITGDPRLIANPNWRTLQYMKFELDRAAKTDPTLEPLRRRFTGRLGELNPDFKAANASYEGIAKQGDAAQTGYGMTAPRVTPSQAQATLGSVTPDQLPYLRQGFASSLADTVERSNLGRDPYEAIFSSTAQRSKLGQVFPEGAERFGQARGLEKDMSLTSRELLGGSPTQPRAEADKLFENGGMADFAQDAMALASGTPPINMMRSKLFAGRGLFGAAADTMRMGLGKSAKQKADQIAPILLNQNPEEAAATLAEYLRQQAARNAYVNRTGMFGSAMGGAAALGMTDR